MNKSEWKAEWKRQRIEKRQRETTSKLDASQPDSPRKPWEEEGWDLYNALGTTLRLILAVVGMIASLVVVAAIYMIWRSWAG